MLGRDEIELAATVAPEREALAAAVLVAIREVPVPLAGSEEWFAEAIEEALAIGVLEGPRPHWLRWIEWLVERRQEAERHGR